MSGVTVHLDGCTVRPGDWLVLCSRDELTEAELETIRAQLPEALRGRVVIASGMTAHAVAGARAVVPVEAPR